MKMTILIKSEKHTWCARDSNPGCKEDTNPLIPDIPGHSEIPPNSEYSLAVHLRIMQSSRIMDVYNHLSIQN